MIIKGNRTEFLTYGTDVKAGDKVRIISEFKPHDKFKSPLVGEVQLENGEERLLGINWNTIYLLKKAFGQDSMDWIDQTILYKGMIPIKGKMGMVQGHIWEGINEPKI